MSAERQTELLISIHEDGDHSQVTVSVHGEFDRLQTMRFDTAVAGLEPPLSGVTIDLCNATIVDSAALGSLIRLERECEQRGCRFTVLVSRPFQVKLMRVSGLFDHLHVEIVDTPATDD